MISAKVIADSISPGCPRLTTLEVVMPRFILAEFNTHRQFSRNSASSRAIPIEKRIVEVRNNPFVPVAFAMNKRGMQAGEELDERENSKARDAWMRGLDGAIDAVERLLDIGVHKQWANRLLEPFSWTTVVVTATEWSNFFALRISPEAQPEMRAVAVAMRDAMAASKPHRFMGKWWHTPYVSKGSSQDEFDMWWDTDALKVSVARCARVSYLTHDGKRDIQADLALHDRLLANRHLSPFEHVARPAPGIDRSSNFVGWLQYRKTIPNEHDFSLVQKESEGQ